MPKATDFCLVNQDFDLQSLKLFALVCDCGSIGGVAQQSKLAASAISKRLSDLERQLNLELLIRHNRGVTPTTAGQCLLRHVKSILAHLTNVQHELAEFSKGIRGYIRLHANNTTIVQFLADDLQSFMQQNDLIKINLTEQISPLVVQDVIDGIADIGICNYASISQQQLQQVQTKLYRTDRLVLVMHPNHPLCLQPNISFAQALEYDFITFDHSSNIDFLTKQAANKLGKAVKSRIQVGNISIMLRLVRQQMGIGIAPNQAVIMSNKQQQQKLKIIPLNEEWVQREFYLVAKNFLHLSDASKKLVMHLNQKSSLNQ